MLSNASSCQVIKQGYMRRIRELTIGQEFSNVRRREYSLSLNRLLNFRRTRRGRYRSTKPLPKLLRRLGTELSMRVRESLLYPSLTGLKYTSDWIRFSILGQDFLATGGHGSRFVRISLDRKCEY